MNKRTKRYLQNRKVTNPMKEKEEVYQHTDAKIDIDFPGFPHGQSQPGLINPKSKEQKKTAAVDITDGEKIQ